MKKTVIILCFYLFNLGTIFAQVELLQSPAYIAMALIDQPSVGKMVDICKYYQLEPREPVDGFRVFAHEDGTVIRFKMEESERGNLPVVEVRSPENAAALKRILTDAGFEKVGPDYYKGSQLAHRRTKAVVSSAMSENGASAVSPRSASPSAKAAQSVITLTKEYKPHE